MFHSNSGHDSNASVNKDDFTQCDVTYNTLYVSFQYCQDIKGNYCFKNITEEVIKYNLHVKSIAEHEVMGVQQN
jgi:hypothetical protein